MAISSNVLLDVFNSFMWHPFLAKALKVRDYRRETEVVKTLLNVNPYFHLSVGEEMQFLSSQASCMSAGLALQCPAQALVSLSNGNQHTFVQRLFPW